MFRTVTKTELGFDISLAVAYFVVFSFAGERLGSPATILLGLAFAVPLALRRVSPALALMLAWAAAILQMLNLQPPHVANAAILIVLYSTARYGTRTVRYLGLISAIVGAVVASIYSLMVGNLIDSILLSLPEFVAGTILTLFGAIAAFAVLGLSWAAGLLVRTRALAAESKVSEAVALQEQQRSEQALALLEERHRIARDMHDVVAHSLAVVIAQADGARYVASSRPELATQALATISDTAREALVDVRILLGQLRYREGEAPQPGMADLDRLIEQLRTAGLQIELSDEADRSLISPTGQLVVFRIVQECLTNALRHGSGRAPTVVRLSTAGAVLHLSVENPVVENSLVENSLDGSPLDGTQPSSTGHGLSGMSERAALAGGSIAISTTADRFRVEATLPLATPEGTR